MRTKPVIEIDGKAINTLEEFAQAFSRAALVDYMWHGNLDTFNDVLRGGFGMPLGGFILRWINSGIMRERLGYSETVRWLESRLNTYHPSNRLSVAEELEAARAGIGSTVFDWLVEVIKIY